MVYIQDIVPLCNITRKQMNNRLKPLRLRYPDLIMGGGRGRGGKYKIHPILIRYLTQPNSEIRLSEVELVKMRDKQNEHLKSLHPFDDLSTFYCIKWNWFGCYNPLEEIVDENILIEGIPMNEGDLCYYSIHQTRVYGNKNRIHIHFCLKTDLTQSETKYHPKYRQHPVVVEFDLSKADGCYNYFANTNLLRSGGQMLKENGYLMMINGRREQIGWGTLNW